MWSTKMCVWRGKMCPEVIGALSIEGNYTGWSVGWKTKDLQEKPKNELIWIAKSEHHSRNRGNNLNNKIDCLPYQLKWLKEDKITFIAIRLPKIVDLTKSTPNMNGSTQDLTGLDYPQESHQICYQELCNWYRHHLFLYPAKYKCRTKEHRSISFL